ncbi:UBN2_3 domain-containing protein [Cucumis melo var. makuwa]|uniref:UBN2_3 domain-containing protein n=1 Tax=Cucumis melo var. makuwa TaxID=1194695 RepID=A0A5A7TJD7_CUCMM|nr:UBN2_3 domain-containing protein [Cucumis melo var. makuwa]TYK24353.1 UBN2_3 domain-containing protein [Cucumis melo var. makuwa]
MVSERDIEYTLETQENTTNDGNQTEETVDSFSVVVAASVDARISTTMDEWFRCLQKTSKNSFLSNPQSSEPPITPHAPPRDATGDTRVGPSSTDGINQPIHTTLFFIHGMTSNTSVPMYSENPITSFPTLSSPYVTNTMAQSTAYHFSGDKLNGNNYFSWSQSVKMVLEGRHKFGFMIGEIPRPPPSDPQERYWKAEDSILRSILINIMEPQIGKPLLFAATAKDI